HPPLALSRPSKANRAGTHGRRACHRRQGTPPPPQASRACSTGVAHASFLVIGTPRTPVCQLERTALRGYFAQLCTSTATYQTEEVQHIPYHCARRPALRRGGK